MCCGTSSSHTQAYQRWCPRAGPLLHHTPAEALGRKGMHNDGLRRAWFWACKEESIDPKAPSRLTAAVCGLTGRQVRHPQRFHYVPDRRLTFRTKARRDSSSGGGSSGDCGTDFFGRQLQRQLGRLWREPTVRTAVAVMEVATAEVVAGAAIEPGQPRPHQATMAAQRQIQMLLNQ